MTLDELKKLKATKQKEIKAIEEAEAELIDNMRTYKCVACMENARDVTFMDGCSHMALCEECERKAESKVCPICQVAYTKNMTKIRKVNF